MDNFDVTGSNGNIVTAGTLAVNGDTITSDGNLTIDSAGIVIIPDADTFQTNDVTSTGALSLASALAAGGTVTEAFSIKTSTDLGAADEILQLGDSAANFITVLGNGNVGIGPGSPGTRLDVTQTATTSTAEEIAKFSVSDDATAYISLRNGSTTDSLFSPQLRFRGSGSTLAGNIQAMVQTDGGTSPALAITAQTASAALVTRPVLAIRNYTTDVLTILANGYTGIGDSSPLATLTVGDGDLFQVAGASGNITTAGTLAVNGDSITADGATLTINAGGNVDVQDALNADSITSDAGGVSIAAG